MSPHYPKQARKNRSPISLNHGLDHRLLSYTAAASAAGVGIMALAQPSQAEIVYTATNQTVSANQTVAIDLNHDGVTDFTVSNRFYTIDARGGAFPTGGGGERVAGLLHIIPQTLNRVLIHGASYNASALQAGRKVGPRNQFIAGARYMEYCISTTEGSYTRAGGQWDDVKNRYLGLQFSLDGQVHFGWARLSVSHAKGSCEMTAVLTGYAYETVAGKAIEAGQTAGTEKASRDKLPQSTLGMLAQGSTGLEVWRREDGIRGNL
jgi:hypothetical protein